MKDPRVAATAPMDMMICMPSRGITRNSQRQRQRREQPVTACASNDKVPTMLRANIKVEPVGDIVGRTALLFGVSKRGARRRSEPAKSQTSPWVLNDTKIKQMVAAQGIDACGKQI